MCYFADIREGEDCIIILLRIPQCRHCEKKVIALAERMNVWKQVILGYPNEYGTRVCLYYDKQKCSQTNFWKEALRLKNIYADYGYSVL